MCVWFCWGCSAWLPGWVAAAEATNRSTPDRRVCISCLFPHPYPHTAPPTQTKSHITDRPDAHDCVWRKFRAGEQGGGEKKELSPLSPLAAPPEKEGEGRSLEPISSSSSPVPFPPFAAWPLPLGEEEGQGRALVAEGENDVERLLLAQRQPKQLSPSPSSLSSSAQHAAKQRPPSSSSLSIMSGSSSGDSQIDPLFPRHSGGKQIVVARPPDLLREPRRRTAGNQAVAAAEPRRGRQGQRGTKKKRGPPSKRLQPQQQQPQPHPPQHRADPSPTPTPQQPLFFQLQHPAPLGPNLQSADACPFGAPLASPVLEEVLVPVFEDLGEAELMGLFNDDDDEGQWGLVEA